MAQRKTTDGLQVYDLCPQSAELVAVAGPPGQAPKLSDSGNPPEGFRWVTDAEWQELIALEEFNHGVKEGFEYCDLPLPSGVEDNVLLTEGTIVSEGRIFRKYGVFDSAWLASQPNAYECTLHILGASSLPQVLRDVAARNSERLSEAFRCRYKTDSDNGEILVPSWQVACDWLRERITDAAVADGAWGWVESPDASQGRFALGIVP
jgi:hypothetical protein